MNADKRRYASRFFAYRRLSAFIGGPNSFFHSFRGSGCFSAARQFCARKQLHFDRFDAEALQFLRQIAEGNCAVREAMACRLLFQPLQHRRHPVGADVGARTLAVVRQPHGFLRVLVADGVIQQGDLFRSVVEQGDEHLAHQFVIVQRNVPQLLPVQHGSSIIYMHVSIVPPGSRANHRAKTLDALAVLPYLGRTAPNWKEDSTTCMRPSSTARAMNPGASGVPKRKSKTSTSLPFSTAASGLPRHSGYWEKRRNAWKVALRRAASIAGSGSGW